MTVRRRAGRSVGFVLLATALAACDVLGLTQPAWVWPEPAPLPDGATAVKIELQPRFDIPADAAFVCPVARFLPFEVRYVADDADQPVHYRWVGDGSELPINWQPGFSARLNPGLEIVAPDGRIIARDGDVLDRIGGAGNEPCFSEYLPRRDGG